MSATSLFVVPTCDDTLRSLNDHVVLQSSIISSQRSVDDICVIRDLKKDRLCKLENKFPELHQMDHETLDFDVLVDHLLECPYGAMHRHYLMDVIVLSMAEVNQCNNRGEFDKAVEVLLGSNFNAVWHSRFHNSVHHVLRVNDISCFPPRKRRQKVRKCDDTRHLRLVFEARGHIQSTGPVILAEDIDNDVVMPGLLDVSDTAIDIVHNEVQGQTTPTSKRTSSSTPPPIRRVVCRGRGFAPICTDSVEVYTTGGVCMKFNNTEALSTTSDLRFAIASVRGVACSHVQLLCGENVVDDNTPIVSESLNVVFGSSQNH